MNVVFHRVLSIGLFGILLLFPTLTMASDKESKIFFGHVGDSTLDRNVNSSGGALQVTAANEASKASIRFGRQISTIKNQVGTFKTLNLLFTAPLDKNQNITEVATLDGLTNAITTKILFNSFSWPGIPEAEKLRDNDLYFEICKQAKLEYIEEGEKEADWSCDTNMVKIYANHRYREFRPLVIKEPDPSKLRSWRTVWGLSGTVGYEKFDYRASTTLDKADTSEVPWSVGAHFGFIPPVKDHQILVTLGYDYQEFFKKQDDTVRCPVDTEATVLSCVSGSFGGPDERRKHLGYLELRGLIAGFGVSLKYTHDFENTVNGLDMPIYLFSNKSNNLNAGLRFGWNDDNNDFQGGVFVGSEFNMFE